MIRSMPRFSLFLSTFFIFLGLHSQGIDFGLRAGLLYGGPVPTEINKDSSSGGPIAGPSVAAWGAWKMNEKWSLRAELGYALKGADYQQIIRNDTLVELELIPNVFDTIPSFYVANVSGSMRLHYLEAPIFLQFEAFPGLQVNLGFKPAFLLGGSDAGEARIQIGEGGVFDDTTAVFENLPDMQGFDLGLMAGATYSFDFGLQLEIRGYRSLRGLYRKGFLDQQGLEGVRMYHTHGYFGVGWRF